MRIQHNIPAMNAYRNYNSNTKALQANLQKLSSGYKINKAGDDAAGLAISEKMRAQITGLEVAQKNAKDGISLVQTAEGAMTEIHTMLNRMFSLAEQSANGTYNDDVDREQLNAEFTRLTQEIDRIADATNFNGKKLLNGELDGPEPVADDTTTAGPVAAHAITLDKTNEGISAATLAFDAAATDDEKTALNTALENGNLTIGINAGNATIAAGDDVKISGIPTGYTAKFKDASGAWANVTDGTAVSTHASTAGRMPASGGVEIQLSDGTGKVIGTVTATYGTVTTTGAEQTTALTFAAAPAGGAAPAGPTLENPDATKLAAFDIDSIDISNAGANVKDGDAVKVKYDGDGTDGVLTVTIGTDTFTYTADAASGALGGATKQATNANGDTIDITFANTVSNIGTDKVAIGDSITEDTVATAKAAEGGDGKALRLRVGDSTESYDNIYVAIKSMNADKLADLTEGTGKVLKDLSVDTDTNADTAMKALKGMINYVSNERGKLGATQNRLDHTINNLSTMQENIQDAEATIRDVDVAEEMMKYTKNNILVQSAQAMLAQANQLPQGVLQLLG